jgi:hypothetical protein
MKGVENHYYEITYILHVTSCNTYIHIDEYITVYKCTKKMLSYMVNF